MSPPEIRREGGGGGGPREEGGEGGGGGGGAGEFRSGILSWGWVFLNILGRELFFRETLYLVAGTKYFLAHNS